MANMTARIIENKTIHEVLASAWAEYHGQRGTAKQLARIMRQLSVADLTRMLAERGIYVMETR